MNLDARHNEAIEAMILFRGTESTLVTKVAELVGVTTATVRNWRKDEDFSRELISRLKA